MAEPNKGYAEDATLLPGATVTAEAPGTPESLLRIHEEEVQPEVEAQIEYQKKQNRLRELNEARAKWDQKTQAEQALSGEKEWSVYGEDHPLSKYYTADEMREPDFFNRRWAELGVYREEGSVQQKDPQMQWMHDRLRNTKLYEDKGLLSALEEFYDSKDPRVAQDRASRIGVLYDSLNHEMEQIYKVERATGLSANKQAYQEAARRALFKSWSMLKQTSTAMAGEGRAGLSHLFKEGWQDRLVEKKSRYSPQMFGHEAHPVLQALSLDEKYLRKWQKPGMSETSPQAQHLNYMLDYREDVYRALRGEAGVEVLQKQENGKITVDGKEVPVWQHFGYPTEKVFRSDLKRTGAAVMNRRVIDLYNDGVRSVPGVMAKQIGIIDRVLSSAEQQIREYRLKEIDFLIQRGDKSYREITKALGNEWLGVDQTANILSIVLEKRGITANEKSLQGAIDAVGKPKTSEDEALRNEVVRQLVDTMQQMNPMEKNLRYKEMADNFLNGLAQTVTIGNTTVPISQAIAQHAIPFNGAELLHRATLLAYRYGMEHDQMFSRFLREWDPSNPDDLAQIRTYAHRNIQIATQAVGFALAEIGKSKSKTTAMGVEYRTSFDKFDDLIMGAFSVGVNGYGNIYNKGHFEGGNLRRPRMRILDLYKPVDPNMLEWGSSK